METFDIQVRKIVRRAIEEDLAWGDVTTDHFVPADVRAEATAIAGQPGIVCGLGVFSMAFSQVDGTLDIRPLLSDGAKVENGDRLATVKGNAGSILKAERVALNLLQRMSGIATETARYVQAVEGLPVRIADTRKTAPGLRVLDKYAVRMGGGVNHRFHLGDGVLVKDNHLELLKARRVSLKRAIAEIKGSSPRVLGIEVEAKTVAEALAAVEAGADVIMLDNMDVPMMRKAVRAIAGRAVIEASGGMTLEKVRRVAMTGVDFISVGALTHSARAMDIALDVRLVR